MASIGPTTAVDVVARTVREASGDIPTASTAEVTVTWPSPFADLNYTVAVVLEHAANPSDLTWVVRARTVNDVTVAIRNTSLGTRSCTVHALAAPD